MPFEGVKFESPAIVGLKAVGKIDKEDYLNEIFPILKLCRKKGRVRPFYLELGKSFKSYEFSDLFEDARFGLKYLRRISKLAVVTDLVFVRSAAMFLGGIIPCPVKVFNTGQATSAKAWVEYGRAGARFEFDSDDALLYIHVHSSFEAQDFRVLENDVDKYIENSGRLKGIVLEAEKFPGWEESARLLSRFDFVSDQHRSVEKFALVTDDALAALVRPLEKHFANAKVKRFREGQYDKAIRWIKGTKSSVVYDQNQQGPIDDEYRH